MCILTVQKKAVLRGGGEERTMYYNLVPLMTVGYFYGRSAASAPEGNDAAVKYRQVQLSTGKYS